MNTAFLHVPRTGGSSFYNKDLNICSHAIGHGKLTDYTKQNHPHRFMTNLRDPYEICVSYYYVAQNLTVDIYEFLDNPTNKLYSYYFEDMDILDFDFVGNIDEMEKSFKLLNSIFNVSVPYRHINKNKTKNNLIKYDKKRFVKNNEKEYEIYYRGLEYFKKMCNYHL